MSHFKGFPSECIDFLIDLRENNNKLWFEEHRDRYERFFLEPAREFVIEMGAQLRSIVPRIHAVPIVNKSLFKIHRDIRFSKNKTPFKTNLAIWFWEGERKRMDCSGFYFHLEPDMFILGAGMHQFSKELLDRYRQAVSNEETASRLVDIFKDLKSPYSTGVVGYKKVPRGYEKDYRYADLLLYNGVVASIESVPSNILFTPQIVQHCLESYKEMLPIHNWLVEALG